MATPISRDDMAVTLAVRDDLGPQYDDAVIGEFLERVGAQIDARVSQQVEERLSALPAEKESDDHLALPICSLVFGIPITAISLGATDGNLLALIISWSGIAAINIAHARRRRR